MDRFADDIDGFARGSGGRARYGVQGADARAG